MVNLDDMAARALVPEQLPHYVQSVSALRPVQAGPCLGWRLADRLVLVAYPDREPPYAPADLAAAEQAVADAAKLPGLRHIVVLAPFRPAAAPQHAETTSDACWTVPLPLPAPSGKLRNMLRRAARDVVITADRHWTDEHAHLRDDAVRRFCEAPGERALSLEAASIFARIEDYLAAGPQTLLYSARRRVPFGRVLHAFEIMREAIRMNGGRGPRLHIAYLLLADRIEAARALPALMRALDIPSCVVSTLDMPVLPAHARLAFAPHEREKIHRARCLLEDIAAEAARDGRSIRYGLPQPHPRHGCRENVHESVYVDADGDVSPCIYVNVPDGMPRATPNPWVFGNVNSEDAAAIWDKLPFADFRADVRNDAPPPPCERCPKRYEEFV